VSGPDGVFEFPSVREGDWILSAASEKIDRGAALVSVRKDIDDVRIQLERPVEILGTVVMSDGSAPPAKTSLNVTLTPMDGERSVSGNTDLKEWIFSHRRRHPRPVSHLGKSKRAGKYYGASVMVGDV